MCRVRVVEGQRNGRFLKYTFFCKSSGLKFFFYKFKINLSDSLKLVYRLSILVTGKAASGGPAHAAKAPGSPGLLADGTVGGAEQHCPLNTAGITGGAACRWLSWWLIRETWSWETHFCCGRSFLTCMLLTAGVFCWKGKGQRRRVVCDLWEIADILPHNLSLLGAVTVVVRVASEQRMSLYGGIWCSQAAIIMVI